ncbi:hypothetical protein E4U54_000763, partial [Claviceps lovelessii]
MSDGEKSVRIPRPKLCDDDEKNRGPEQATRKATSPTALYRATNGGENDNLHGATNTISRALKDPQQKYKICNLGE